ncbi:MAG: hypothetical protein WD768_10675 [Phycisphaeraceae bacterium]
MKTILSYLAWAVCAAIILFAVANPHNGIVYDSPMSVVGVTLIGLGLCKMAHERRAADNASGE